MRILWLCPYAPFPPRSGGALRMWHLLQVVARQHEVWCLTFLPADVSETTLEPLRALCRVAVVRGPPRRSALRRLRETLFTPLPDMAWRNTSAPYIAALDLLMGAQRFDLVHAASIEMGPYALHARHAGLPVVFDDFNAEYLLQRRAAGLDLRRAFGRDTKRFEPRALLKGGYSLIQWRKLVAYETLLLQRLSTTLAVSEDDRAALLRLFPHARVAIVPNGVDSTYYAPQPRPSGDEPPRLVFTGTLDYRPNIDAVQWLAKDILPRILAQVPDARLTIAGRSPTEAVQALHDGSRILVRGDVPDMRPYIAGASAYIIPMRVGGGVRLKLLEALSMQAPVVSTSLGAEGVIGLRTGEHLLLADDAQAFADATARLLQAPELAQQLGSAGRELVRTGYDWEVIGPRLEQVYNDVKTKGRGA